MLSFEQALAQLLSAAQPISASEDCATLDAAGRVLALPQYATQNVPAQDNSAMDGYAVRVADVAAAMAAGAANAANAAGTAASENVVSAAFADSVPQPQLQPSARPLLLPVLLPVAQRIAAGQPALSLAPGSAARIFTGATIPPGADAVIMQEQCTPSENGVLLKHLPVLGEHIRYVGSDLAVGERILPAGQRLRAQDIGLLASVGIAQIPVFRRLRVAVFFTGDELQMPGSALAEGGVYNTNRFLLTALLNGLGCTLSDFGQVPDELAATRNTLRAAAREHDLILSSGGVSVGEEDHIKAAVAAEGQLALWRIAMKPGKPLAFGSVRKTSSESLDSVLDQAPEQNDLPPKIEGDAGSNTAFIGLPGNPVSCLVTFLTLVRPFILRLQGVAPDSALLPRAYRLRADFDYGLSAPNTRREFLRVRINAEGGLDLFPEQGSSVLSSAVWADGLLDNPPEQAIRRGDWVRFLAFSELLH